MMEDREPDRPEERERLRRENRRLRRAVEELALLNELATALTTAHALEEVMQTVIRRAIRAVGAAQGVITLGPAGRDTPLKTLVRTRAGPRPGALFRPDEALFQWVRHHKAPLVLNDPHHDDRFDHVAWDPGIRSVLCVPMLAQARLVGVLTVFNKGGERGFGDADQRLLAIIAGQSAQVIENARLFKERDEILRLFGLHTAPAVVEELRRLGPDVTGARKRVCVLFLDIRGFTALSERAEPEAVVAYLNTLFGFMIEAVVRHYGIIHQLLGDGFMALFGAPLSHGNDCENAVAAALDIVAMLAEQEAAGAIPATRVGIGIHAGEVVAGAVGSASHKEYKVTGDAVNLAARIEQLTKHYDAQLLVSEAVWQALDPPPVGGRDLGEVMVRGRLEPVRLYGLA